MAATDRRPPDRRRPRWLLALPLLVVGVLGVALAVGAAQGDDVPGLPPLPPTTRADVELDADVSWDDGRDRLVVDVGLALPYDADPLTVTHWAKGDADDPLQWRPAVVAERRPEGQVVLHVGAGVLQTDPDVYEYEPATPREERLEPGATLSGRGSYDPALDRRSRPAPPSRGDLGAVDEVRVCVWEAGVEPAPGARPAVCADTALDGG